MTLQLNKEMVLTPINDYHLSKDSFLPEVNFKVCPKTLKACIKK